MIKGRIAEAMIEEVLKASGNDVYRFGYVSILQNLVQRGSNFDRRNKNAHQVQSIPDFLVLNDEGNNFFVEVKFRTDPNWLVKDPKLKWTAEYWKPKLILVTLVKPHFRIITPESILSDRCSFEPLETDRDFHVSSSIIESFQPLVERFLGKAYSSPNAVSAQDSQNITGTEL
jgi:hypothetical protein